jgi:rRNA processing protein Gar1
MARGRKPQGRTSKRPDNPSGFSDSHYAEEQVDDMAVAASYAASVYTAPRVVETVDDDNEIALTDHDDDGKAADDEKQAGTMRTRTKNMETESATEDSDSSEDDESPGKGNDAEVNESDDEELDVEEERATIQKMSAADVVTVTGGESLVPPRTEHELDSYQTPLPELEEKFQFSLTVDERRTRDDNTLTLCPAGTVKNHLVKERTLIVESRQGNMATLDEGSVLVIQIQKDSDEQQLVTLGKIFEVFGPVRRPLYSVRIPPPQQKTSNNNNNNISNEQGTEGSEIKIDAVSSQTPADSIVELEPSKQESSESKSKITAPEEGPPNLEKTDPWSSHGMYTRHLSDNPELETFFVRDEAKVIDAEAMLRMSTKGCGMYCRLVCVILLRVEPCATHFFISHHTIVSFRCIQYL